METNSGSIGAAFLGALVRWALTALLGGLVAKGIISAELMGRITTEGTALIVTGMLALVVPLAWSFYQKIVAKVREKAALDVNPTAPDPEAAVTKKTKETPLPAKLAIAFEAPTK